MWECIRLMNILNILRNNVWFYDEDLIPGKKTDVVKQSFFEI